VRRALLILLALWPGLAFAAPPVVVSSAPDKVGVTIYRNPGGGSEMSLDDLGGFALIAETRTVDLPPGEVVIRFEGVASGIVPQSALIFGADVREKNRDAALLSKRGLLDAFTGQRVTIRRTDKATGKVVEEAATLRSSQAGVVIQTARGIEPVFCTGLSETLIYPGVPATLSAKPTLSMTTKDQPGGKATITLVYLSGQFDWRANYIAQLNADATAIDLFAWLTMASNDDTSFVNAQTAAIAGKVNRVEGDGEPESEPDYEVNYNCWPATPLPPAVAEPAPMAMGFEGDIVVTAQRREALMDSAVPINVVSKALLEALGDLKLYRIPMPVTVAARAQKQVAFLTKPRVKGRLIYRVRPGDRDSPDMLFRFKNDKANGLGEPLPAGGVALFQQAAGQRMLVGEASIPDKTIDEEVDLVFGDASNVISADTWDPAFERRRGGRVAKGGDVEDRILTVTNANPVPVNFEAEFGTTEDKDFSRFSGRMVKRPGKTVWVVTVPANGEATLKYRAIDRE
jgi:hypothetical protein